MSIAERCSVSGGEGTNTSKKQGGEWLRNSSISPSQHSQRSQHGQRSPSPSQGKFAISTARGSTRQAAASDDGFGIDIVPDFTDDFPPTLPDEHASSLEQPQPNSTANRAPASSLSDINSHMSQTPSKDMQKPDQSCDDALAKSNHPYRSEASQFNEHTDQRSSCTETRQAPDSLRNHNREQTQRCSSEAPGAQGAGSLNSIDPAETHSRQPRDVADEHICDDHQKDEWKCMGQDRHESESGPQRSEQPNSAHNHNHSTTMDVTRVQTNNDDKSQTAALTKTNTEQDGGQSDSLLYPHPSQQAEDQQNHNHKHKLTPGNPYNTIQADDVQKLAGHDKKVPWGNPSSVSSEKVTVYEEDKSNDADARIDSKAHNPYPSHHEDTNGVSEEDHVDDEEIQLHQSYRQNDIEQSMITTSKSLLSTEGRKEAAHCCTGLEDFNESGGETAQCDALMNEQHEKIDHTSDSKESRRVSFNSMSTASKEEGELKHDSNRSERRGPGRRALQPASSLRITIKNNMTSVPTGDQKSQGKQTYAVKGQSTRQEQAGSKQEEMGDHHTSPPAKQGISRPLQPPPMCMKRKPSSSMVDKASKAVKSLSMHDMNSDAKDKQQSAKGNERHASKAIHDAKEMSSDQTVSCMESEDLSSDTHSDEGLKPQNNLPEDFKRATGQENFERQSSTARTDADVDKHHCSPMEEGKTAQDQNGDSSQTAVHHRMRDQMINQADSFEADMKRQLSLSNSTQKRLSTCSNKIEEVCHISVFQGTMVHLSTSRTSKIEIQNSWKSR